MKKCCENCKYSYRYKDDKRYVLVCRRYPPKDVYITGFPVVISFPKVEEHDKKLEKMATDDGLYSSYD